MGDRVRLAVVGCGDVAFRTYLPSLEQLGDVSCVSATCDLDPGRAREAADFSGRWSGEVHSFTDIDACLGFGDFDGLINLTPGPSHSLVTRAALASGVHVFSEKPLANSIPEAQELIALAEKQGRLLLCAPATTVTNRWQLVERLVKSGEIGHLTLVTGQHASMGPAGWRGYTGNPEPFYSAEVGPILDLGVYVLHAMTSLFGPALRVSASGTIAIPQRKVLAQGASNRVIEVGTFDHVLMQLEFPDGLAQLTTSFAVPASRAPVIEVHCTDGSVSVGQEGWFDPEASVDVYSRIEEDEDAEGWRVEAPSTPGPVDNLIGMGSAHFIACLRDGAKPVLTAEHACHVLEIALRAKESAASGRALALETTF
ncbi:MAG: Gfo/Idh/MocA family oxidoreductase [Actinomycetota bacterium]|nr:Gfo/Idh/MocA family oxidoreductase [Actinomycetota bacterium]